MPRVCDRRVSPSHPTHTPAGTSSVRVTGLRTLRVFFLVVTLAAAANAPWHAAFAAMADGSPTADAHDPDRNEPERAALEGLTADELELHNDPLLFDLPLSDSDPPIQPEEFPSPWEHFINLQLGAGYKDNIGLSHLNPDGSPFSIVGLDLMLFRLPIDGFQFDLFVLAEDRRYWDATLTDKEQTLISQTKARKIWENGWSAGAGVQYVFQDQVFDASTTETDIGVVQVQVHTFSWVPEVRLETDSDWFFQLQPKLSRVNFLAPLDDYWEVGPTVEVGKDFDRGSRLTLGYSFEHRAYDSRQQVDRSGVRIPGQALKFDEHAVELEWRYYFDSKRRWRSQTKIEYELNRDNGSGFFDFDRARMNQHFRYRRDPWQVECSAKLTQYDYLIQSASSTDPSARARTELLMNARAEFSLSKRWTLFAEYEFEKTFSNQILDEYTVHAAMSGVNLEF